MTHSPKELCMTACNILLRFPYNLARIAAVLLIIFSFCAPHTQPSAEPRKLKTEGFLDLRHAAADRGFFFTFFFCGCMPLENVLAQGGNAS
jgi:hypothetical protein